MAENQEDLDILLTLIYTSDPELDYKKTAAVLNISGPPSLPIQKVV